MIKALFGELRHGRIARLPYLGYGILIGVMFALLGVVLGFAYAVISAALGGGQERQALTYMMDTPNVIYMVLVMLLIVVPVMFAGSNLQAKRWRDIGLPGWTTVAVVILIGALLRLVGWEQIEFGFGLLMGIGLLFIPSGALNRRGA